LAAVGQHRVDVHGRAGAVEAVEPVLGGGVVDAVVLHAEVAGRQAGVGVVDDFPDGDLEGGRVGIGGEVGGGVVAGVELRWQSGLGDADAADEGGGAGRGRADGVVVSAAETNVLGDFDAEGAEIAGDAGVVAAGLGPVHLAGQIAVVAFAAVERQRHGG